jgi:hypothetical protein
MPGAAPETPPAVPAAEPSKTPEKPTTPEAPAATGTLTPDERTELEQLRTRNSQASKWENRSKANAKKLRDLAEAAGLDVSELNLSEFDPKVEFDKLRNDFESSERERTRSEVARTEGVDLEDVHGNTEEEMRASAQRIKARIEAAITKALEAADKTPPSAAPASTVTSDGKITGPVQITSQDELKKMTTQQILQAEKDGRLDQLLGKRTT